MSNVRLSVIVPTIGRPTLRRTLSALRPQLAPGDEVLIVAPLVGLSEQARAQLAIVALGDIVLYHGNNGGYGDEQRNHALELATGTHICFIDDDDEHTEYALQIMRMNAFEHPTLFRMLHPELGGLWKVPKLRPGNVGTPMILTPNERTKLGRFRSEPPGGKSGDWTFIRDTCHAFGNWSFHPELVAICHREPA